MRKLVFALACLVGGLSQHAVAQTTSVNCEFPNMVNQDGKKKSEPVFEMRFLIDRKANKFYVMGNNGSNEVAAIDGSQGAVTFVEVTAAGSVMVTAITATGSAVHSRNTIIGDHLVPSQYYGQCNSK